MRSVLFVGNSLTYFDSRNNPDYPYYNHMPQMLQSMIDERNQDIHIDHITHNSTTLFEHATYIGIDNPYEIYRRAVSGEVPSTVKKILSAHWDVVVLQDAGTFTLIPILNKIANHPALLFLDSLIKEQHAKTVLYEPETSSRYPSYTCIFLDSAEYIKHAFDPDSRIDIGIIGKDMFRYSDVFYSGTEELLALDKQYKKMAAMTGADIVNIGAAFEKCKKVYPEIKLYISEDDAHPSIQGSYLIACMFFRYLTGQKLADIKYHDEVNETDAEKIHKLVDSIPLAVHNAPKK